MLKRFPFYSRVEGAVLYHHDRADGKGAMGRSAKDTPISGQIIHITDAADAQFSLYTMDLEKYNELIRWINGQKGTWFSEECCRVFTETVSFELLESITGDRCIATLDEMLPPLYIDAPIDVIREMAGFFADITDYKSHFTWRHSIGIAEKAEKLAGFYGYDRELCDKLYIAGALHDIGKLLIPNDILEKPGKLTGEEYKTIQNHAMGTWELLKPIGGMEDITRWAALHHEKLDGSGYPFGLKGEELGKHERMIACLDIYQALTEERPYKTGMSHDTAMEIMRKMGRSGQLDQEIIEDIDLCFQGSQVPRKENMAQEETVGNQGEAWRCPVCGYVYEGKLSEGFICPQCKQPGSVFEKM